MPDYRLAPAEMSIVHYDPDTPNPRANLFATFPQAEMHRHAEGCQRGTGP